MCLRCKVNSCLSSGWSASVDPVYCGSYLVALGWSHWKRRKVYRYSISNSAPISPFPSTTA